MKRSGWGRPGAVLLVCLALAVSGCGGGGGASAGSPAAGSSGTPGSSGSSTGSGGIEFQPQAILAFLGPTLQDAANPDPWGQFRNIIEKSMRYPVRGFVVNYNTRDAMGQTIAVSGVMLVPWDLFGAHISVPILSLQHPTHVERRYSPSVTLGTLSWDPELTVPLGIAVASTGYIVVMADYPGMGVNHDPHPYCHLSLANACVDLAKLATTAPEVNVPSTSWNGQLSLIGYSEGGYATMACAREIQLHHQVEFTLSAVAPLEGPYALSTTMRNLMLQAPASYPSPYSLPYLLAGYEAAYPGVFDFKQAVVNNVPGHADYPAALRATLDGSHTAAEITSLMRQVPNYAGPASILSESFKSALQQTSGPVYQALYDNDSYRAWVPSAPVALQMFHNRLDDLVPMGNADDAYAGLLLQGANANVTLDLFEWNTPLEGSIHAGTLPQAFLMGYLWMDARTRAARSLSSPR